ncbi:ComEC family competence protein [Candidatus Parcubacteria bacterium]|nr:MAG: ComEC family competence protein [Candidatus Parcubacteria bacterium]
MRSDALFFLGSTSFVTGTIAGGIGIPPIGALLVYAGIIPFLLIGKVRTRIVLIVGCFFVLGAVYCAVDDFKYHVGLETAEYTTVLEGVVVNEPRRSIDTQTATVRSVGNDTEVVTLFVRTELYPKLRYGDVVLISGEVIPPPADSYARYMRKEHVHGTMFYPEIEVVGNEGNYFLETLYGFRNAMKERLALLFSQQHAAFLSGILLGEKDEFSPEFLDKLSVSGTMHLMALSGLNMTIIVFVALGIFTVVFRGRKRPIFIATFSLVALFVIMTAFQVSAVRAALMAFLVGLASVTNRIYKPHVAIACAALVISLWNPQAPLFDLGFQLSFLATIAIIYLAPVLKLLPPLKSEGILGWRDALGITLAAQLGVVPLTIANFENFSFTSLLANIAILAVIPLLTVSGFIVAFLAFLFMPLASLLAKPMVFLIDYVIAIVELFSIAYLPFNPHLGIAAALLYYACILYVCFRWYPKAQLLPYGNKTP